MTVNGLPAVIEALYAYKPDDITDLRMLLAAKKDERYHREYIAVSQRMLITILCGFARKRSCPLPEYEPPSRKDADDLMADKRSVDDIKSDFMTKLNKLKKGAPSD